MPTARMRARPRPTPVLFLIVLGVSVAKVAVAGRSPVGMTAADATATAVTPLTTAQPNVLVVVTDDQLDNTVTPEIMPNLYREMVQNGVNFDNGFVSNSWCCPSRASILSGQYSGNDGVWTTGGALGLTTWRAHESSTLATWLHDAGYRTGIVGKYMNGFGKNASWTYTPPGWDTTAIFMDLVYSQQNAGFYNYKLYENGQTVTYGSTPADYSTRVLTGKARAFMAPSTDGKPWFMYLAYNAPHGPGTPDPLDTNAGAGLSFPMPPSICEPDVSDKPAFIRNKPLCSMTPTAYANQMRKGQAQLLASIDRGMGQIFDDLRARGQLENTLVLFLSDNGHELYHHRVRTKELPYEESIGVPLLARWDALGAGAVGQRSQLAVNVDLAPTIVDAAGVTNHDTFDGQSLLGVIADAEAKGRPDFLIEHKMLNAKDSGGPSYCGVRNDRYKFVLYQTGERELYDLAVDPYELNNQAGKSAFTTLEAQLHTRTLQLCQPAPPGWTPQ